MPVRFRSVGSIAIGPPELLEVTAVIHRLATNHQVARLDAIVIAAFGASQDIAVEAELVYVLSTGCPLHMKCRCGAA
jgi:hypothetical protein